MRTISKILLFSTLALAGLSTSGCVIVNGDASLTISNQTSYVFVEINLSPTDSSYWGDDLLGADYLYPGDRITIDAIDCDSYDVRIIDDTNAECVLTGIDLCFGDDVWVINDAWLDDCVFNT